ncbi:MAG: apolipoprotein N-acyltransferase [Alteromonas macleodii]|jgi:apolipoprotein N-acyltransferase
MIMHPSDLAARFMASRRVVRWLVPLGLGVFASLGHETWISGIFAVSTSLILAFLIVPTHPREAAWFGWLLGLSYFAVTMRWLVEPFLVDPVRHGWMAPFAIIFMAGGLALFWAFSFWLARWIAGRGALVMMWLPITLAVMELARGHVLSGFPWGLLSYTLIGGSGDVLFASFGPYGTTLLLIAIAGSIAYCLSAGSWRIWVGHGAVFIFITSLIIWSVAEEVILVPQTTQTVVRLIQPNAPQHQKWDGDWMTVFFDRAIEQTAAGEAPDVIVWPETSIPALLDYAQPWIEKMSIAARGAPTVAGIQRREGNNYFNSAILIEGPQTVTAISDKSHLVPFGEYIPLSWLLKPLGLGTLVDQVVEFTPGSGDGMMHIDGLGLVRVLICYEGIFPEDMQRDDVRPDVLLIITNDAWFGKGAGPRQHLRQAQARAVEQGLPVIRVANTGVSAVISPWGDIIEQLPLNEAAYLDVMIPMALPPTLYARIGDWPLTVLLTFCILVGWIARWWFVVDPTERQR